MLKVLNFKMSYGNKEVLKDATFELDKGIKALVGPNGAGKTTLMKSVTGRLKDAKGSLLFNENLLTGKEIQKHISFFGDNTVFDEKMHGIDYLKYVAKIHNVKEDKLKEVIERTDVGYYMKKDIGSYSLGMKNRLLVAISILAKTEFIFLDEPLSGLDPTSQRSMKNYFREIARDRGILLSSHSLSDIDELTKDVLYLKDGVTLEESTKSMMYYKLKTNDDDVAKESLKSFSLEKDENIMFKEKYLDEVLKALNDKVEIKDIKKVGRSSYDRYFELFPEIK